METAHNNQTQPLINLTLNDRPLQVREGATILEAARENGVAIPTLCHHKDLTPYGACRLCLVEIVAGGRPGLEASCVYRVSEGLVVKTDTERVVRARNVVFEILMARSPGSDKIRKLAAEYGVTQSRISLKPKENCILCGLCVRVCAEVSQRHAQNFAGRGIRRTVMTPFNKVSPRCIGCGACAYLCPTGNIKIEPRE